MAMKKKGFAKGGAIKKMMGGGALGMKKKGYAKGGAIKKMKRGGRA